MKNKYMICAAMILGGLAASAQNVGINVTGATPHNSSILDLNTGNTFTSPNGKGMLIPNVALTGTGDATTVASPATSLMVYNTATAGAGATAVTPGYYYWDGTKWVQFQSSSNASQDWKLTGNSGTTAGTNFIGTTDAVDFVTKTNNAERMRVTSAGNVGIGTTTPATKLEVREDGNLATWYGRLSSSNSTVDRQAFLGTFNGNSIVASHNFNLNQWAPLFINTTDGQWAGDNVILSGSGKVGIGTATPATKLDINNGTTAGAIKIVDGTEGAGKVLTSDANGVGTWSNTSQKVGDFMMNGAGPVSVAPNQLFPMDNIIYNPTGIYTISGGKIIVPEAGCYQIVTDLASIATGYTYYDLMINGNLERRAHLYNSGSPSQDWGNITIHTIVYLTANSQVWIQNGPGGFTLAMNGTKGWNPRVSIIRLF